VDSVAQWLEQLGLGQYASIFAENDIDGEVLPDLTESDLEKLGVTLGHRKKILKAIAALQAAESARTPSGAVSGQPSTTQTPPAEAERRQLTVMFCDLVGSTQLTQKLDPEDLRDLNRAYQDACTAAIERYEGYVARYMGDGILAYFGYPQAHEDDAERSVYAGLGILEAIADLDEAMGREKGVELSVRLGIATGPVVVGDLIGKGASQESAVVGETPNLAARLQAIAAPDTMVISSATHDLAAGEFEYEDLGIHELKGITESVRAWRAIAPAAAKSRFEAHQIADLTPLVGREHEIGLLLERWEQANEGDGQVVR
jgi:class 3 adenylate cyclase